jgi:hypothetical protein
LQKAKLAVSAYAFEAGQEGARGGECLVGDSGEHWDRGGRGVGGGIGDPGGGGEEFGAIAEEAPRGLHGAFGFGVAAGCEHAVDIAAMGGRFARQAPPQRPPAGGGFLFVASGCRRCAPGGADFDILGQFSRGDAQGGFGEAGVGGFKALDPTGGGARFAEGGESTDHADCCLAVAGLRGPGGLPQGGGAGVVAAVEGGLRLCRRRGRSLCRSLGRHCHQTLLYTVSHEAKASVHAGGLALAGSGRYTNI